MAFICKECAPESAGWLFRMLVSFGPCEDCHRTRECIEWSGPSRQKKADPVAGYDRYDDALVDGRMVGTVTKKRKKP